MNDIGKSFAQGGQQPFRASESNLALDVATRGVRARVLGFEESETR
jgi:hypothetical protein